MRFISAVLFLISVQLQAQSNNISVKGLLQPVTVYRDSFGVNHIYAQNEHDLFFTQGYCAAKDRLFQFEIWRRQASGTMAEILGPRELKRDMGARLFRFRGNMQKEFDNYHSHGAAIITAFTDGINAYIKQVNQNPQTLPLEFQLLGIQPGFWTPDIVVSRHQGLLANLVSELNIARAVVTIGTDKVKALMSFEPGNPDLNIDTAINKSLLFMPVIELYEAFRIPVVFQTEDLVNKNDAQTNYLNKETKDDASYLSQTVKPGTNGSNNWVVSGKLSASGFPLLANDPHRSISVPSLRYVVHLHAPGWNVIGGGEPEIPGVSIGHNDYGAWGLTIFGADAEDLYIYDLRPGNLLQYKYDGLWETMKTINDTIHIKNQEPVYVQYHYTRHGPVTFIDSVNRKAYAVRCAWLEPGGAPYLASLRIDQCKTWEAFCDACTYSHIPAENMVWADKAGNIGWQASAIAPVRKNWSGLVPVSGDGRFEWDGYLPIKNLPHLFDPAAGFIATANENNVPENYAYRNAVGWEWGDSFRVNRIREVLGTNKKFISQDMQALQTDYVSLPAKVLVPLLKNITSKDKLGDSLRLALLQWDYSLNKESVNAAVYVMWERVISDSLWQLLVPAEAKKYISYMPLSKILQIIINPSDIFGTETSRSRDTFLSQCFEKAILVLHQKLGDDINQWQYGQTKYHYTYIKHSLNDILNDSLRTMLDAGPAPRGGYGNTVCATDDEDRQRYGASLRMVCDLKDWDKTVFINTPGQSGNPESYFYKNLFPVWTNDEYKTVFFSEDKIKNDAFDKMVLQPE